MHLSNLLSRHTITKIYDRCTRPVPLFLVFWVLSAAAYLFAAKGGFVRDYPFFLQEFHDYSFSRFVLSPTQSLYYGVNLVHYILFSLFGQHALPWILTFTALHSLNAAMVFRFLNSYALRLKARIPQYYFLLISVLFLLGPMATEPVIWKVCSHYLISVYFILQILNWLFRYLSTGQRKYAWYIGILFYLSTFFLELFYTTPLFILIITSSLRYSDAIDKKQYRSVLKNIFVPLLLLFGVYFLSLKYVLGAFVARLGTDQGSSMGAIFKPGNLIEKYSLYFGRVIGMDYLWPQGTRDKWYQWVTTGAFQAIAGILVTGLILFSVFRFRKMRADRQLLFSLFLLSLLSLAVALPMYFYPSFLYEGFRYYYFASIFIYAWLILLLFSFIRKRLIRHIIIGLFFLGNAVVTLYLLREVRRAAEVQWGLLKQYKWTAAPQVVLLSMPNYLKGVSIMGRYDFGNFQRNLHLLTGTKTSGKIYEVAGFNMTSKYDGTHVMVIDNKTIKVFFNQFGNWWWDGYIGASDYKNELYTFDVDGASASYTLTFHEPIPASTVLLYAVGKDWHVVDLKNIGGEQW